MPTYNQYVEGKLRDSVKAQALSQARVTAGQEVVLHGTVLPDVAYAVGTPLQVSGTGLGFVDSQAFVITRVSPRFSLREGFMFDIEAWQDDAPISGTEGPE